MFHGRRFVFRPGTYSQWCIDMEQWLQAPEGDLRTYEEWALLYLTMDEGKRVPPCYFIWSIPDGVVPPETKAFHTKDYYSGQEFVRAIKRDGAWLRPVIPRVFWDVGLQKFKDWLLDFAAAYSCPECGNKLYVQLLSFYYQCSLCRPHADPRKPMTKTELDNFRSRYAHMHK